MALVTVATLKATLGVGNLYPDADLQQACDASIALIQNYVDATAFAAEPAAMKEAALALAVDIWQTRTSPGGQNLAADFTPSPWRLGKNLVTKVHGLLAPYLSIDGVLG